jgi:broad specificity phosphatase PhoE
MVCSPLVRASRTAELIAAELRTPFYSDGGLIECDFGSFEGRPIQEVMREHGIIEKTELARILPADAEEWDKVSGRALRCIKRWQLLHPVKLILFVCHDAVMQSLAEKLCGHWFENQHAVPYLYSPYPASWTVEEHQLAADLDRP